jgi:hypothetical protein
VTVPFSRTKELLRSRDLGLQTFRSYQASLLASSFSFSLLFFNLLMEVFQFLVEVGRAALGAFAETLIAVCENNITSEVLQVTRTVDNLSLVVGGVHVVMFDTNGEAGGCMHI